MREKTRTRIAEKAAPLLEEGETMRASTPGFEGPRWALFFGLIGTMMTKPVLVAVTDRNLYVMKGSYWSVASPKGVEERSPLGTVEVKFDGGFPFGALDVGPRRVWIGRIYGGDAKQVAEAAGGTAS
ncbi:MAG TPA: hypothetical protein VGB51_04400 [Actinomycetota bacterium]